MKSRSPIVYKRRRDMVPGDIYYWEPNDNDVVCFLVQVLDDEIEAPLENRDGTYIPYDRKNWPTFFTSDGFFTPYRIFEMVSEEDET